MSRTALDEKFERVIDSTAKRVSELGFKKRDARLKRMSDGIVAVIDFQKSTESSREKIRFTINLAVIWGELLEPWQPPLEEAGASAGHLRERIGMLTAAHADKWWDITEATDVVALAAEIAELIAHKGAPYLLQYADVNSLAALWKSGKSPGLTEKQRLRYLEKLSARQ